MINILKKYRLVLIIIAVLLIANAIFVFENRNISDQTSKTLTDANIAANSGHLSEAIQSLENLHQKQPNDQQITTQLAEYYFQNKQYSEFEKLVESSGIEGSRIYSMKAYVFRINGNQEQAISMYEKAIIAQPRSINNYSNLASYYKVLNNLPAALDVVKRGIAYSPNSVTLNLLAANYSLDLGLVESAKGYAAKVLETDSGNKVAKEILVVE